MAKTILLGVIIVACASIAVAQNDYKRWEIFGGYSHNQADTGLDAVFDPNTGNFSTEREGFNGFSASVTRNFSRYFGLKGDLSRHYKSRTFPFESIAKGVKINSTLYNFLTGSQIKDNSTESTFKPFAHALAGVVYSRNRVELSNDVCIARLPTPCPANFTESQTAFAGALGGGLDIRANNRFDIRAIQIDYNPTWLGESRQQNIRIGVGLVFH